MTQPVAVPAVDLDTLRQEIRKEYAEVASNPTKGFHFHTRRPLARMLGLPRRVDRCNARQCSGVLRGHGKPLLPGRNPSG